MCHIVYISSSSMLVVCPWCLYRTVIVPWDNEAFLGTVQHHLCWTPHTSEPMPFRVPDTFTDQEDHYNQAVLALPRKVLLAFLREKNVQKALSRMSKHNLQSFLMLHFPFSPENSETLRQIKF